MRLGFLTFVPNHAGPDQAGRSLWDGVELFRHAERLGFDTGWVRVRHFEDYLSSPLTFLTAVGQHTERIHLGTGVIPMRYEDPIRLAEDALTADLLTRGRLELGVANGIAPTAKVLDGVFGPSERSFTEEAQLRLGRFLAAVRGESVGSSGSGLMSVPAGADLHVTPASPGLIERIWYGPGTLNSARRTGELGLDVHVSTLNSEVTGESFAAGQARQLREYKAAFAASDAVRPGRAPRIAAGRIILPFLTAADEEPYAEFRTGYASGMDAEGRPLNPDVPLRYDLVHAGKPADLVLELQADEALAEATELTVTLPAEGGLEAHKRTLELIAERIAPELGWTPGG